jgi:CBS domain-containing protein
MIAREAMTPALTLPAGTPLAGAARLLLERGAPEALVIEDDRLVGILTHSDLLRALVPDEPEAVA